MSDEIPTPEGEKMLAVHDKSQAIGEFLEWANEQGYVLCTLVPKRDYVGDIMDGQEYCPQVPRVEQLLAEFFDINLEEVERERQELLAELRRAAP